MRNFLLVLAAFSLLAVSGCFSREGDDMLARVQRDSVLRIGVKADSPPFGSMTKGERSGFDIDIAYAVANRLGVQRVDFVTVTADQRSDRVVAGEVDCVIASMTRTRYRERRVDFSIPYFQDGQSLMVPTGSPIGSYLDLGGRRVGVVKGSTSSWYLKQVAPDALDVVIESYDDLARNLALGRVDAISSDRMLLMGLKRRTPALSSAVLVGDPFTVEPYAIAVPENQSAFRKAIDHALIAMWEDGTYQGIRDTWFGPGSAYELTESFAIPVYPK